MDNSLQVKGLGAFRKAVGGRSGALAGSLSGPLAGSLQSGILDSSLSLDFLIQFLRKNTDSKILAEPQINIADNELGRLFVGAQVPFINYTTLNPTGSKNDSFQYKNVGIILEVTPHINSAEEVMLRIRTESSSIRNGQTLLGGAILDTRNFRTDLMVKSGQTLVLGGIIQREQTDIVRKVPLLGSIPILGWAFKKKDKGTREVELMVFLRPKVTRSPEQAQELLETIERKAPSIKNWREETQPENENRAHPPSGETEKR
jgi:general secretion pathway protein D